MAEPFTWLKTSPSRRASVIDEINASSQPGTRFYAMVATSTLIASLGLIANSAAVVIGAMLVAPLMTPIFGIALALVRGDGHLLKRAIQAEVIGVLLSVVMSASFGMLPLALQVTPEMLARTEPNLLDLLVAVLAGFAGTYAMIDERLSPALPGVAIATAIVPPLANAGLCLALGAYEGAAGSFLLFLANFLSILLVASAVFICAGMSPLFKWTTTGDVMRRFGLAAAGFIMMAVLLTYSLIGIVQARRLEQSIRKVLVQQLSQMHDTSLYNMIHELEDGKVYVLATVFTPKVISPEDVLDIQQELSSEVEHETELIVRSIIASDISPTGSTSQVTAQNLDGIFLREQMTSKELKIRTAERIFREKFHQHPGLKLIDVEVGQVPRGPVIVATVEGVRDLSKEEISEMEEAIRDRLQDDHIHLIVQSTKKNLFDSRGQIAYGWTRLGPLTPEKERIMDRINDAVMEKFKDFPSVFPYNVNYMFSEDSLHVVIEAGGIRIMTPGELASLEKAISEKAGLEVKVSIRFRAETVVTGDGYSSFREFAIEDFAEREKKMLRDFYDEID
ncbi:MAG: TIGR00341 family protein [Nitrospiraceae bacterium]|nr:MAG: TIGR00341 family protein [Nitrospiraceae bacterium]